MTEFKQAHITFTAYIAFDGKDALSGHETLGIREALRDALREHCRRYRMISTAESIGISQRKEKLDDQ